MSIHQSFFSRNNTIISNNYVNTGRASMTHLFYGNPTYQTFIPGFSRFIFNIDLLSLQNKIDDKAISSHSKNEKYIIF
jgi:hypothetical protein